MSPTRAELESTMAKQYGFDTYDAFREFFAATYGKGFLRALENELKKKEKENTTH